MNKEEWIAIPNITILQPPRNREMQWASVAAHVRERQPDTMSFPGEAPNHHPQCPKLEADEVSRTNCWLAGYTDSCLSLVLVTRWTSWSRLGNSTGQRSQFLQQIYHRFGGGGKGREGGGGKRENWQFKRTLRSLLQCTDFILTLTEW